MMITEPPLALDCSFVHGVRSSRAWSVELAKEAVIKAPHLLKTVLKPDGYVDIIMKRRL